MTKLMINKTIELSTNKKRKTQNNNKMKTSTTRKLTEISYLNAEQSAKLDKDLMGEDYGFINEQLMENAGISTAHATVDFLHNDYSKKIIVICGPGNNGGDGLVAARHLKHFGFNVVICYPKPTNNLLFINLVKQCQHLRIPILEQWPTSAELDVEYDLVIDAIFGYSFQGTSLREPFHHVIQELKSSKVPILSIDVPSGWNVNEGNVNSLGLEAAALVSLPVPKLCAKKFTGVHYVGGRFVPIDITEKYELVLPDYQGTECVVRLE
jgi:hydroxyethylthiazole kinase-like uncharacterized protein yjeF